MDEGAESVVGLCPHKQAEPPEPPPVPVPVPLTVASHPIHLFQAEAKMTLNVTQSWEVALVGFRGRDSACPLGPNSCVVSTIHIH